MLWVSTWVDVLRIFHDLWRIALTNFPLPGDTVGDPFKDTSGPSLNILIKLMSMISLTISTLMRDDNGKAYEDWATWYYGLIPLVVMIIGCIVVYWCFWREATDAAPSSLENEKEVANGNGDEEGVEVSP